MASETDADSAADSHPKRVVRAPRELAAGLGLIALAAFALWAGADLDSGSLRSVGPGMLPRWLAVLVGLFGLGFAAVGFLKDGEGLGRWPLRGPLLMTLGVIGFALTIRTAGLVVSGPLVVLVGGAASAEARPKELAILALVATLFSIGLFRYVLGLPIPVLRVGGIYL